MRARRRGPSTSERWICTPTSIGTVGSVDVEGQDVVGWNEGCLGSRVLPFPISTRESNAPAVDQSVSHYHPSLPALTFLSTTLHGTIGYFPEGMPLAYLLATVMTGLGLLIGSLIHVSGPEQVAQQFASPPVLCLKPEYVGRITGMVDCHWDRGEGRGTGDGG